MVEKYKLQYFEYENKWFAINWAGDREDYLPEDCRVRAIMGSTDVDEHNQIHFQRQTYSEPMTLKQARDYVVKNIKMLGTQINDCVGLTLEDVCKKVELDQPILIRNQEE